MDCLIGSLYNLRMKKIQKYFVAFVLILGIVCAIPAVVRAQTAEPVTVPQSSPSIADNVCRGVIATESGKKDTDITIADCSESEGTGFDSLMKRVINIFSVVVGSVSVIMIIIGGFRYIISGGDSAGVTSAKNTILYAIVGLVIVLFSQAIIRFVLTNFRSA